ncbi:sporulation protein YqfD [Paenibacillus agricola]|uniref:Sporulation protein YqfD n=1 Tax=Paenibacillus agricola TaxID=2716264 RepID=A0ABX0J6Y8_9BACL|nr:sporulation protein YqfD [Paenibacillus agricola]NHN30934.1 sporulation protein YqfD [Paenibacillus agricola]
MKSSILSSLRGYVIVEVRGQRIEQLINRIVERRMSIWDIQIHEARAQLCISLRDFFLLRPLLKETGSRIHVLQRYGLPFTLNKVEKRKLFVAGFIGFIIGLYLLSSLVWQVRVEGNESISTTDILQTAKQEGIYKMQWKFRLKDTDVLSKSLQNKLPGTAWVGVEVQGTQIVIKVVEATIPDVPPLLNPRNLVATKSALITSIYAEKGRPVVKPNTYVKKGDILISGILGDELNRQTVVAMGKVKGIVWYTPSIEVPLLRQLKIYTGAVVNRSYLVMGSRALQLSGYGELPFEHYETLPERKSLHWRDYTLPLGWLQEKVMEIQLLEQPLELQEARSLGMERAKQEIITAAGNEARVVNEKILHEKTDNGKVYMEVHLEVEESIVGEQAIIP